MTIKKYLEEIKRTMPKDMTGKEKISMLSMGISGEAGEIIDYLKKVIFHGHEMDDDYIEKEIGDLLWYIGNLCNYLDIDLSIVMDNNINKLYKRYPNGFDSEKSKNREDEKDKEAVFICDDCMNKNNISTCFFCKNHWEKETKSHDLSDNFVRKDKRLCK